MTVLALGLIFKPVLESLPYTQTSAYDNENIVMLQKKIISHMRDSQTDTHTQTDRQTDRQIWLVACLLNVPATCECISGTDLLRQFYVPPH